ncbi:plasmid pRiA4b ORF-3 family protein [Pontibacter qinzhouensis]|uniref:Plasmid pRiA4b ORF-3 family protein n=1 Tax=Pontibacter qinzhouensis TaxID=2603253 RepID=A0A5C8K652_9BACT|nr:plasmid pRiA4b ORF-3 family protein [Pontibacter qinzhouensis]TXK46796.1 plasmid pRiA4b ORF-3 family protein [Pontibacter qinzhouensis]
MKKLTISSLPVIDDFELFLTFLKAKTKVPLTAGNNHLKRTDLARLNQEMHFKAFWAHDKSMQPKYPLLHFFYHVVIQTDLARLYHEKQAASLQLNHAVLEQYEQLTRSEKYFFLLETAWCHLDYEAMEGSRSFHYFGVIMHLFELLNKLEPGQQLLIKDQKIVIPEQKNTRPLWVSNQHMYYVFWFLNLYDLEPGAAFTTAPDSYTFPFSSFGATATGKELIPVLLEKRPFELWNDLNGDELSFNFEPVFLLGDQEEEGDKDEQEEEQRPEEPFLVAFKALVAPGELEQSLLQRSAEKEASKNGVYRIKVSLSKQLYRTILIGASATFEELHLAIQDAYNFDNDHLYAFFLDGKRWSRNAINDPYSEQPPYADEVTLSKAGLYEGKRLLYLFDFGDEWQFALQVLLLDTSLPEPKKAIVVEAKGDAPEQYWSEEEE